MVALIMLSLQLSRAQDSIRNDSPKTKIIRMDSTARDTGSIIVLKHSPTKAALLSAALPGLGQIYNRKYWKLPILYAGLAISAYFLIDNQRNYNLYYEGLVNYSNTNKIEYVQTLKYVSDYIIRRPYYSSGDISGLLNNVVNYYRVNRDWSFVALAGTYVLGIIDATVDAYLFDYDINDNLAIKARPSLFNTANGGNAFGLRVCLSLH